MDKTKWLASALAALMVTASVLADTTDTWANYSALAWDTSSAAPSKTVHFVGANTGVGFDVTLATSAGYGNLVKSTYKTTMLADSLGPNFADWFGGTLSLTVSNFVGAALSNISFQLIDVSGECMEVTNLNFTSTATPTTKSISMGNTGDHTFTSVALDSSAANMAGGAYTATLPFGAIALLTEQGTIWQSLSFKVSVASGPAPALYASGTLTNFVTTNGTASAAQSISVTGTNLTASITCTAPTGFEVSTNGSTYGGTANVPQNGGLASGTLYVRLAAATAAGSYTGNVALTSAGASSVNVGATGTVYALGGAPTLYASSSLTNFVTTNGTASAAQSISVTGSNLTASITSTAPTGFEVSTNGSTYGGTASLPQSGGRASGTLYVRLAAATAAGSYTGNVALSSAAATTVNVGVTGTVYSANTDTTAPTPNPMTFAVAPALVAPGLIVMTATTATDPSGPVQYYFENTNNSANSGWSTSPVWTNTGWTPDVTYGYRVRARDAYLNATAWSAVATVTPDWIFNGGFELPAGGGTGSDATGWIKDGAFGRESGLTGSYGYNSGGGTGHGLYQTLGTTLVAGHQYRLTFWLATWLGGNQMQVRVGKYTSGSHYNDGSYAPLGLSAITTNLTGAWTAFTNTFMAVGGEDTLCFGATGVQPSDPGGKYDDVTLADLGPDTDHDGIPDWWMLQYFGHPTGMASDLSRAQDDADGDGLTNLQEYQLGTNPRNRDTDGDGLSDGDEVNIYHTDPTKADTDGDGLTDYEELMIYHTNPLLADTDGDGLSDGDEVKLYHTNPLNPDTDGDGVGDWYEVIAAYTSPTNAADKPNLPYPLPKPNGSTGASNKPVKVFILSGQSNMVGEGNMNPLWIPGTLSTIVKQQGKFPNLMDTNGNWSVLSNVYYRGVISAFGNGPLTAGFGASSSQIGPELGLGAALGYAFDGPILLIKASIGNRALGWDFLPPGSPEVQYNGYTYAGYGETPDKWLTGSTPTSNGWYAGREYDECFLNEADWSTNAARVGFTNSVQNVVDILDSFPTQYPQWAAQGFQIAGYVWWQGNRDILTGSPYTDRYETNMTRFIKQLRAYYANRYPGKCSTNTPFVLATGCGDPQTSGDGLVVANAQLAVSNPAKHPEFAGNVKTMDTRGYWRDASISPGSAGYHYNLNAETYMLTGDALGRGMISLLSAGTTNDYAAWSAQWPGATLSDPNADYDGDGLSNDYERIWGLNPTNAASRNAFTSTTGLAAGTFCYTRRAVALSGLIYTVWTSTNLKTWTQDTGATQTPGTPVNGVESVTVTLSPALLSGPRLFVRMRAAQ